MKKLLLIAVVFLISGCYPSNLRKDNVLEEVSDLKDSSFMIVLDNDHKIVPAEPAYRLLIDNIINSKDSIMVIHNNNHFLAKTIVDGRHTTIIIGKYVVMVINQSDKYLSDDIIYPILNYYDYLYYWEKYRWKKAAILSQLFVIIQFLQFLIFYNFCLLWILFGYNFLSIIVVFIFLFLQ